MNQYNLKKNNKKLRNNVSDLVIKHQEIIKSRTDYCLETVKTVKLQSKPRSLVILRQTNLLATCVFLLLRLHLRCGCRGRIGGSGRRTKRRSHKILPHNLSEEGVEGTEHRIHD